MKLGDFLNTLARKSNMEGNEELLSLLSNSALAQIEMPETLASQFNNSLMSLEGAKNNPAVLNHFKPIILKAADEKFSILAEKYGFSDEVLNEKSTYKKFDILESKLEEKIKAIEAKASKTNSAEKEAEYQKQITDMQKKLSDLADARKAEVESVKQTYENQITEMHVKTLLSSKKYATKELPIDVNVQVARTLLDAKLKQSGAILVRDADGTLKLKQAANPEMDYVDAGYKPVTFADFADKTLAESKLLDVSPETPPAQRTQQQPPQTIPGNSVNRGKFDAALQASMADVTN